MVNLAEEAQKLTEIRIHDHPEAAVFLKNQFQWSGQDMWTLVFWVSGFDSRRKAVEFFKYWQERTRGTASRIAKGWYLFEQFAAREHLEMAVIPFTKDQQIERVKQQRRGYRATATSPDGRDDDDDDGGGGQCTGGPCHRASRSRSGGCYRDGCARVAPGHSVLTPADPCCSAFDVCPQDIYRIFGEYLV